MARNQGDLNVEIGAKLDKVERAISKMQKDFRQASGKMERQSKQAGQNIEKGLGGSFKRLASLALAAFSTERLIRFGYEATQLAGKLEGVEAAFKRVADDSVLDALRQATRGTVTDLELMQQAVRANNFKIPLDQLAKLFEFATVRAQETGESVDYLVNSIISGIGRKSPLILDNLGISAVELRKRLRGVGVEAANVADIAQIIGGIASEELAKAGNTAVTTAQKTQRLTAEFQNLQTQIGQELTPAFNQLLTVTNAFLSTITKGNGEVDQFNVGWDLLNNNLQRTEETLSLVEQSLGRQLTPLEKAKILWRGFTDEQIKAAKEAKKVNDELKNSKENLRNLGNTEPVKRSLTSLSDLEERLKKLQKEQKNATTTSYWEAYEKAIKKVKNQINNLKGAVQGFDEEAYNKLQMAILQRQALEDLPPATGRTNEADGTNIMDFPTEGSMEEQELLQANIAANEFLQNNKNIGEQLTQNEALANQFFGVMVNSFNSAGNAADNFSHQMQNAIASMLIEVTKLILKLLVVNTLLKAFGVPVGVGTSFVGGLGIPALANGGVTTGPTLAMIGDNPSGKEAVIPFERMGEFMGKYGGASGGDVNVTGRLVGRGEDLIVTIDKTQARRSNFYRG